MATLPNPLPRLATDPSGRSLGLQLPPGRLIDTTDDGPWHEPLLWHAEKAASPGTWKAIGAQAARAGLLPVLVDVGDPQGGPTDWELMPDEPSYPGDHDADDVLAEYWRTTPRRNSPRAPIPSAPTGPASRPKPPPPPPRTPARPQSPTR